MCDPHQLSWWTNLLYFSYLTFQSNGRWLDVHCLPLSVFIIVARLILESAISSSVSAVDKWEKKIANRLQKNTGSRVAKECTGKAIFPERKYMRMKSICIIIQKRWKCNKCHHNRRNHLIHWALAKEWLSLLNLFVMLAA